MNGKVVMIMRRGILTTKLDEWVGDDEGKGRRVAKKS